MLKFSTHNLPDPKDRTPNTPAIIISAKEALNIYNGACTDGNGDKSSVDAHLAVWLHNFMTKKLGWSKVAQYGTTFLLVADVTLTDL